MLPLPWFACLITTLAITDLTQAYKGQNATSFLPTRYLVSLNRNETSSLEDFKSHLDSKGIQYKILHDMTEIVPDVFFGCSLKLADEGDLQHLESSVHVEEISQVQSISRASVFDERTIDTPIQSTPSLYPPQVQTRINELHEMGVYGQGVKVALIDDGIDCSHPALGNGFGPGFKIGFGKNLALDESQGDEDERGDSTTPHGTRKAKQRKTDDSPCTQCPRASHGTHAAGIVAASDVGYGFMGVAPNVTLGMYNIYACDDEDFLVSDKIIAGMLHAYKDGADIISISIGGYGGWGQGEEQLAVLNKLVQNKGSIIVVAAANDGAEGLFHGSRPASATNAISVGSVEAQAVIAPLFKASTGKELMMYRTSTFNLSGEYPIYLTANSTDDPKDACDELPKHTPNLTDYIVLLRQGTCQFFIKVHNVAAKGAKHIIFYMNSTSVLPLPDEESNVSIAAISMEDGQYIFNQAKRDPTGFKISFPSTKHLYVNSPDGGFPSSYSQYGPSFDFDSPQPAVAGVGGNVVSTFPMNDGGYASHSGTSMATPQIAGVAALILSARGKNFNGITMRSRLATTTKVLNRVKSSTSIDSAIHQGGGLIDAFCAVWTNTTVSTPSLVLNDTVSFRGEQEFTIFNNGTRMVNYILTHRPAVTLQTFSPQTKYGRPDLNPSSSNQSATAQISPQKFSIKPGSSQVVRVNFSPPEKLDPHWLAVYSGFIVMTSDAECESHNLPYYGVLGSLKEQLIFDRGPNHNQTANYPYLTYEAGISSSKNGTNSSHAAAQDVQSPLTTTFVWDLNKHNKTVIHFGTLFGSPFIRADVLPGTAVLSQVTNNQDFHKSFRGTDLIGLIPNSEYSSNRPRTGLEDIFTWVWNAAVVTYENKEPRFLPDGSYKVLLRALRITGRNETEADWDYWVSPEIKLKNSKG
ncbi:hypothetical protein PCASD_17993 [Puccinia coronata f. sp. avenae]|uniref:Peptidase S8/S53 domain-containing protein n=1 Tax=Puccinia coronata f. sp. avenae TaxID=200324 RepID=A0A2N5U6I4_9BASI|nr:hypothetical protein PCASD_17993 [Puccinia coronata f. sp. avenae]